MSQSGDVPVMVLRVIGSSINDGAVIDRVESKDVMEGGVRGSSIGNGAVADRMAEKGIMEEGIG